MKKTYGLALFLAAALTLPIAAEPLQEAAGNVLPPSMTLTALSGERSISFRGETFPYQAWQLLMQGREKDSVLAGYVFEADIAAVDHAELAPFFHYGLTKDDYRGLSEVNKAFFDTASPLHQALLRSVSDWADAMMGGAGAHLQTTLSDLEPIRRVSGTKSILYTAGARLTFSSEGIILPLYAKGFLYRDGNSYRGLLLLVPDESKRPLSYAMEDMAIEAANAAAARDRKAFIENLSREQGLNKKN